MTGYGYNDPATLRGRYVHGGPLVRFWIYLRYVVWGFWTLRTLQGRALIADLIRQMR